MLNSLSVYMGLSILSTTLRVKKYLEEVRG